MWNELRYAEKIEKAHRAGMISKERASTWFGKICLVLIDFIMSAIIL